MSETPARIPAVMQYIVRIPQFEGPFDLLLDLVDKAKIPLAEIPIARIAEDYLTAVKAMHELDIRLASDFIRMAGTLLYLKSRSLIPARNDDGRLMFDDDFIEDDLFFESEEEMHLRLAEYRIYKEAAARLAEYACERKRCYERFDPEEQTRLTLMNRDAFLRIAADVLAQMEPDEELEDLVSYIYLDPVTVEEKMERIIEFLRQGERFRRFSELLEEQGNKAEKVATFLAILELSRQGTLHVSQEGNFTEITVELDEAA